MKRVKQGIVDLPLLVCGDYGLNSALGTGTASILALVAYLQSILLLVCWIWGLEKCLPWWTLSLDPLSLTLPNSKDYRSQPLSSPL
jgi:hypothetical protein